MKLFIAGTASSKKIKPTVKKIPYVLESFYYIQEWQIPLIKKFDLFLLDSGAFTYLNAKNKKEVDFDKYLTDYINFINEHDIKYFFELDIDSVVGLKKVEEYRRRLEKETNKKCIPVWHKSRGIKYFEQLVKEYDYVAIGGIVTREILPREYKLFHYLIKKAHENNCKVHGLGFTSMKGIFEYNFDSVDSTSWTAGHRFGTLYQFKNQTLKIIKKPPNTRVSCTLTISRHNLIEWIKFVKYVDEHKNDRFEF